MVEREVGPARTRRRESKRDHQGIAAVRSARQDFEKSVAIEVSHGRDLFAESTGCGEGGQDPPVFPRMQGQRAASSYHDVGDVIAVGVTNALGLDHELIEEKPV